MRVPLVQLGVPSPKKPWRAEAQRFAHAMGKRKRLGETTSRPFLACYDSGSGSGPHGTTPDWRGWYEGKQVYFLGPLVARCEDTTHEWVPWVEGDVSCREPVSYMALQYSFVYVAGFSLAGFAFSKYLCAIVEGLRG